MSTLTYEPLVLDSILKAQIQKKGAVLIRKNEQCVKMLVWQDIFPVRHDLYFLVEILQVLTKKVPFPATVHHLLLGLQDRLMDCAESKHYEELLRSFIKYKAMYHTVLNIYFQQDSEYWNCYLLACRQWRLNIACACIDLHYTHVPFENLMPTVTEDSFKHTPACDIRLKAMMKYLKYFSSEGKRYLRDVKLFERNFDIPKRLRSRQIKDQLERDHMKRPQRPLSMMSKKELHNKRDGVETRFNLHMAMIAKEGELITESEYIERLQQQSKCFYQPTLYYPTSANQTDVVTKTIVEYFGRKLSEYRRHTCECNVPFDVHTGDLLEPEDDIDAEIRTGSWTWKNHQQIPAVQDLEKMLIENGKLRNGYGEMPVSQVIWVQGEELLDLFIPQKYGKSNSAMESKKLERPLRPDKPKMEVKLMYDGETLKNMDAHKIPAHSGAWKKEDPSKTKELRKAQARSTSKLSYEKLEDNGESSGIPLPHRPAMTHLPGQMMDYSNVVEFKDSGGHYIIATTQSKTVTNDNGPVNELIDILKKSGGVKEGENTVLRGPENRDLNDTVEILKRIAKKHGILINSGAYSRGDNPEVRVIDLSGKKISLAQCMQEINDAEEAKRQMTLPSGPCNMMIEIERDGDDKIFKVKKQVTDPKTGKIVTCTEEIKSKDGCTESLAPGRMSELEATLRGIKLPPLPPKVTKCYVCRKLGHNKKCGHCLSVNYCSVKCQAKNWEEHKALCRLIREEAMLSALGPDNTKLLKEKEDDVMPTLGLVQ